MGNKLNYILMMLGLCLGTAAMIPEFSVSLFDFSGTVCKLGAAALIVISLIKQKDEWESKGAVPTAFVTLAETTSVMAIITILFDVLSWIGTITGIISIVLAKKAFNVQWNNAASVPVLTIACATMFIFYEVLNENAALVNIAAIAAYVLIILNVAKTGEETLGKLKIAAICGIVTSVLYLIKIADIIAWIPYLEFAIMFLFAFLDYKKAVPEANFLFIGAVLLLVEEVFDSIPTVDIFICPPLMFAVITLSILGWIKVLTKMENA